MTSDELIELKREAKKHAELMEAAGLHRSRIYTLIHSDLPIVIDQLLKVNYELENRDFREARMALITELNDSALFPAEWIIKHFA